MGRDPVVGIGVRASRILADGLASAPHAVLVSPSQAENRLRFAYTCHIDLSVWCRHQTHQLRRIQKHRQWLAASLGRGAERPAAGRSGLHLTWIMLTDRMFTG